MSSFREAISEGDGISVIPLVAGDVAALVGAAASAGAEAVAVRSVADAARVPSSNGLPVIVRDPVRDRSQLRELAEAGAAACVLAVEELGDEGELLEDLDGAAGELGLDSALVVRDEEELALALDRLDPEIFLLVPRGRDEEEELERTLDLLADVPAGKLVIVAGRVYGREDVLALEEAGVDAILVGDDLLRAPDFAAALADLTGVRADGASAG